MLDVLIQLFESGYVYLIVYVILLFHALIDFSSYRRKLSFIFSLTGILILIFILAFRWETGTDWEPYYELFKEVEESSSLFDIYHFDLGYVLLNKLVQLFSDEYTVFLLVNSILGFSLFYYLLHKIVVYPNVSIYILYCSYYFSHFMGGNRRMIAIIFSMFFIYYVYKGIKSKAFFNLLGAFLFHRSSLICAIAFFIPKKLFSKKYIIIILSLSAFFGVTQLPFKIVDYIGNSLLGVVNHPIIDAMTFYTNTEDGYLNAENINPITQTLVSLVKRSLILMLIYFSNKKYSLRELDQYLINLYILSVLIYSMFVGSGVLQVLSTYFAILEIFILGRILIYYSKSYKLIIFAFLMVYGFLQLINSFTAYPELYIPYKSIFS